jgi:hypothetical protein
VDEEDRDRDGEDERFGADVRKRRRGALPQAERSGCRHDAQV